MKTIKDKICESPKKPCNIDELFGYLKNDSPIMLEEYDKWIDPLFYKSGDDLNQFKLFLELKGLYLDITPEFYTKGINWNWQLWWYIPKEQWKIETHEGNNYFSGIVRGTYMYGDNGEYPTREKAELGAFELAFRLLENNAIEIGKPDERK